MRVEIDAGTKSAPCFDERDFRAGLGKRVGRDASGGSATDHTDIVNLSCHALLLSL